MKRKIAIAFFSAFLCYAVNGQVPEWSWARGAGGLLDDWAMSVKVDGKGNAYLAGGFNSPVMTFGQDTTTVSNGCIFLAKYDVSGNIKWAVSTGSSGPSFYGAAYVTSSAVDSVGNIYVIGDFDSDILIFGQDTLRKTAGDVWYDIFIVKYDSNGNVLWARSAGGRRADYGNSCAVDALGYITITGSFWSDTLIFGGYSLVNAGGEDLYLAKYDPQGNVLWAKRAGDPDFQLGKFVAVDFRGNAYVTGEFYGTNLTFDTITLINSGQSYDSEIFIAKFDPDGNVIWAKIVPGSSSEYACSIAVDALGNPYLTGDYYCHTLTLGSFTLTNVGAYDFFLVKYDTYGNVVWATSGGGPSYENAMSVAVDESGNTFLTGNFCSPQLVLGSFSLNNKSPETSDIFLVKYDPDGNVLWAKSAGDYKEDEVRSVAVDLSGNAYVAGFFTSPSITFGTDVLTNTGPYVNYDDVFIAKSDNALWINNLMNPAKMELFPNPATKTITVTNSEAGILTVFNSSGVEILQTRVINSVTTLDVSNLPAGLYLVKLAGDSGVRVVKFIKQYH